VSGGSRPGTASGLGRSNVSHADGAMAALSRQLVQAKMAEADAQRKHRYTLVPPPLLISMQVSTAAYELLCAQLAQRQITGQCYRKGAQHLLSCCPSSLLA